MSMKISNELWEIEPTGFRFLVYCLEHLRYGIVNCKRGKEIFCLFRNCNMHYPFHRPAIGLCVTVDFCRSYANISQL